MTNKLMRPFGGLPLLLPQDIMEEFGRFFGGLDTYNAETQSLSLRSFPRGDVYVDKEGNRVIELALAGFSKDQLSVVVKDDQLTISADKCKPDDDDCCKSRTLARRAFKQTFSNFSKEYDLEQSEVSYVDGLLKIVVPKLEEEKEEKKLLIK